MDFNNVYFPPNGQLADARGLSKIADLINTYTVNSAFDHMRVEKLLKDPILPIHLHLNSGSNHLQLEGSGDSENQQLSIRFEGEGIRFKILFEKNQNFKSGYLSLEFFEGADHLIKAAVEKCILACFVSDPSVGLAPKITEMVDNKPSKKRCDCATAATSSSGAFPILIEDFTRSYVTHYRYSNWDEWGIFTCNHCHKIWFIQSSYCDRPPYVSSADVISEEKLRNFQRYTTAQINSLVKKEGIYILNNILSGAQIIFPKDDMQPSLTCRCADFDSDTAIQKTQSIQDVTDFSEIRYQQNVKNIHLIIHSCRRCNTGWVLHSSQKGSEFILTGVKKISPKKMVNLPPEDKLQFVFEHGGLDELMKLFD